MSIALHIVLQNIRRQQEEYMLHMRQRRRAREEAVRKKVKVDQEKNRVIKTVEANSDEHPLIDIK